MSSSPRPSPLHCPSLPPSFCHLCPSICSSSIRPSVSPSVHPSTQPCSAFYPALSGFFIPPSLHPHISQSATLFQPLITPSRPPLRLSTCIFISSLPERRFIVRRQRTRLSLPFVIVCVFILSIYFSPHSPLRRELFSFLPSLAADVTLCSPFTLSLRLMC